MNRRGFFSRLVGGVAAAAVAPFLPKPAAPPSLFNPRADLAKQWRNAWVNPGVVQSSRLIVRGDILEIDGVKYDVISNVTSDGSAGYEWNVKTLTPCSDNDLFIASEGKGYIFKA